MAIKILITKGRQHASTILFLFGFITDAFLLPEIENPVTKYLGLMYLMTLAIIILAREWIVARNTASRFEQRAYALLTFGVALFSGSALSFIFIYALRSAAFAVSWPLFILLLFVMVANEYISSHNYRFTLDIGVLFVALTFYFIYDVPILFGHVNDAIFFVSIFLSVAASFAFVWILKHFSETAENELGKGYALSIGVPLFVAMLYFLNLIPAVPLSLKASGIYHYIEKLPDGDYVGRIEPDDRLFAKYRRDTYHMTESDNGIYFFSSVSAPAEVSAPITHVWEYYDERRKKWITSTTIAFDMTGGRHDGYRAFSHKQNVAPGMWRVTVKVDDKRIIGRQRFYIETGKNVAVEEVRL